MKFVKKIEYPLSPDYQSEWGTKEALREVIANAMDTGEKIVTSYSKREGLARVRDWGDGVQRRHLVMGISEKNMDTAIGQFGEGMKLAALVFARLGRKFRITTGNLVLKFSLEYSETFETSCLVMREYEQKNVLDGTEVHAECSREELAEAKELFIKYRPDMAWLDRRTGVIEESGKLFVRGVYIKDLYSTIFSYNLDSPSLLNRDRSSIGDREVVREIAYAIDDSKSMVWRRLIDDALNFTVNGGRMAYEWSNGLADALESTTDDDKKAIVRERLKAHGLTNAVLSENPTIDKMAQYHGYRVLRVDYYLRPFLLDGGIPRASDVLSKSDYKVKSRGLTRNQEANLDLAKQLAEMVCAEYRKDPPKIEAYESITTPAGKTVTGQYDGADLTIRLVEDTLDDQMRTLRSTIHELAHHISGDGDFGNHFQTIMAEIGAYFVKWFMGL